MTCARGSVDRFLELRQRAGRQIRKKLRGRSGKIVKRPPDELRQHLLRRGAEGQRADEFLAEASRQLNLCGPKQGEIAAYLLREALGELVKLGGGKPFDLKESAKRVVTTSRLPTDAGGSNADLERMIDELEEALGDPNEVRLENALRIVTRRKPMRGDADLLDRFMKDLEKANRGLHARIDHQKAVDLYKDSIEVVESLFGPLAPRLASIDDLLKVREPSSSDVDRLLALVGDDRHFFYFFEKVEGPGWMRALIEQPILHPPKEGGWPAGPYLFRLIDSDPNLIRNWLAARAREDLNPQQAAFLLRIAVRLKSAADLIADLADGNLDWPHVEIQVESYLSGLSAQELRERGLRRLVIESLKALLAGERGSIDQHLAARVLEVALQALALGEQRRWLQILVHRLREVAEPEDEFKLLAMRPLGELSVDSRSRSGLELIAAAVRDGAEAATEGGLAPDEVVAMLEKLEQPLRRRFTAHYMQARGDVGMMAAKSFLIAQISTISRPTPEELALLRAVFAHGDNDFGVDVREALGPAPSTPQIDQLPGGEPMPEALRRPHSWLVAVPEDERGNWLEADRLLSERFGGASVDGVMFRVGTARFAGATSPIPYEELTPLDPKDAAKKIAGWQPPPEHSFLDPSAEGLANELTELVSKESRRWLATDPRQIVASLESPRYVAAYLDGLEKSVDQLELDQVRALIEATSAIQPASENARAEGHADADVWGYAAHRGVRLIRLLNERDLLENETFELAWATTAAAVRAREPGSNSDGDPLSRAINRPWSSAIETAISLASEDGSVDPRLLELLEECLVLERPDGELGRAIIATRLPWLRHVAPQWFSENEDLLIGEQGPNGLGMLTFVIYLEWGNPQETILAEQRKRVIAALDGSAADFALRHLLHGLIWGMEGFEAVTVCEILASRPELFSEAAKWLALAIEEPSEALERAIELWRETLGQALPPEASAGWGWFAVNEHINDETWLEFTLQTAAREKVNLSEPEEIAKRAERMAPNPKVLRLLSLLLDADPKAWELEEIGAVGLRLLRLAMGSDAKRKELRERLLERGFHDATEID